MKTAFTAVLMLIGATALAAEVSPIDTFRKLDRNADGKLSSAEAKVRPELETAFESLDTDHDGFLSPSEFGTWNGGGKAGARTVDPTTVPSGSGNAQHMPKE
jgi:Ca2+-binding EF-hand superfamily protein